MAQLSNIRDFTSFQKLVEESLSWQKLGVNRDLQVFKLNFLNSNLPNLIPWGVLERGKKDIPMLFLFPGE